VLLVRHGGGGRRELYQSRRGRSFLVIYLGSQYAYAERVSRETNKVERRHQNSAMWFGRCWDPAVAGKVVVVGPSRQNEKEGRTLPTAKLGTLIEVRAKS
jgi:hypothetical protein